MSTIKTVCPSCQSRLNAPQELAGDSSQCPRCGNIVAIPHAGLNLPSYWLIRVVAFFGFSVLGALMGDASFLLIPVCGFVFWVTTYHRNRNIGNPWPVSLVGLIPGSILYFGVAKTGSGKRRSR